MPRSSATAVSVMPPSVAFKAMPPAAAGFPATPTFVLTAPSPDDTPAMTKVRAALQKAVLEDEDYQPLAAKLEAKLVEATVLGAMATARWWASR